MRCCASLAAVLLVGCSTRSPFVMLTVEDPDGIAAGTDIIASGSDLISLSTTRVSTRSFPLTIAVTAPRTGELELWVEARASGSGETLGRAKAKAVFARRGRPTAVAALARPCAADPECQDDSFCDGTGVCRDALCVRVDNPCTSNFACVVAVCDEENDRCVVSVDHALCDEGQYCDTAHGCVPGEPCLTSSDCDDGLPCNGAETCLSFRCLPGLPLSVDDQDPCTVDGCDDGHAAGGLDPVFHLSDPSTDGAHCDLAAGGTGICRYERGGCYPSACGDGIWDVAVLEEVCDDGPANGNEWSFAPHCNTACSGLAPYCGDRLLDEANETCDEGAGNFDGWRRARHCNTMCAGYAPYCGDGEVAAGFESCDHGTGNSDAWSFAPHCNATCSGQGAHCGDGVVSAGLEVCDEGLFNSDQWSLLSGCNATCSGPRPHCGDGIRQTPQEACDDGLGNDDSWAPVPHCNEACSGWAPHCGDGIVFVGIETCDDGAQNSDDWSLAAHCNSSCSGPAPYCGDDVIHLGAESCDDGPLNGDAWSAAEHCNSTCTGAGPACGDSMVQGEHEDCDDGVHADSGNGCSDTCWANNVCGDGIPQILFEQCDDQNGDQCDGCRNDCLEGCVCSSPGACLGANWCDQGECAPCSVAAHCGPGCAACSGTTPVCAGATAGCVCTADHPPRGSCAPGTYCNDGVCSPCSVSQYCGQDCVECAGVTPACGGAEVGCIVSPPTSCDGQPDFTLCQVVTTPDRSYDVCIKGVCVSPGCGTISCNSSGPSFAQADSTAGWQYPDTNLRVCYDSAGIQGDCTTFPCAAAGGPDLCGQDAQYGWDVAHQDPLARWTRWEGDEPVVIDGITGLVWQGCLGGFSGPDCASGGLYKKTWVDALTYCDGLTWAGYADWRLPDSYEITSLADCGPDPALRTPFRGSGGTIWSSSTNSVANANAFVIDNPGCLAANGSISGKTDTRNVRCLRGRPLLLNTASRYLRTVPVVGQPVVADGKTGLVWQGCTVGQTGSSCEQGTAVGSSWQSALAACEGLTWGGSSDWRLPNVTELLTITDGGQASPSIDVVAFPALVSTSGSFYWTSSSGIASSSAWAVMFSWGQPYLRVKTVSYFVLCVR